MKRAVFFNYGTFYLQPTINQKNDEIVSKRGACAGAHDVKTRAIMDEGDRLF